MDFLMVNDGSFLGTWAAGSTPIYGMVLAVVSAILVIFFTRLGTKRLILKCVVGACAVASIPLGLEQVGFDIQLHSLAVTLIPGTPQGRPLVHRELRTKVGVHLILPLIP